MIDQEKLYTEIQNENWEFLISTLHIHKNEISTDALLTQASRIFVTEFLRQVEKYPNDRIDITDNLEKLWMLDKGRFYKLSEDELKIVICEIVNRKRDNLVEAYNFAKELPNELICKNVIEEFERHIPKNIEHSQSNRINVTETRTVENVDYTINLFKSLQEVELFQALKGIFDTYQIYPNVAISCLLNWKLIKDDLTDDERKFYFTGIVDFVVFDQAEGFKPKHFFELDSTFHDTQEQKKKDKLKDNIFAKAGVKIRRIRKQDKDINRQEFTKLIRELITK
jgi:very-short-patch-repair endonuclease